MARLEAGADLVTGARLMRQDRFVKRNTSKVYNRVTGVLSGAPGRDFNSGYKVMTADVARDVTPMMYGEMHRYLTVIAHDLGYQVVEEAVQHHPRMSGESKYGLAGSGGVSPTWSRCGSCCRMRTGPRTCSVGWERSCSSSA